MVESLPFLDPISEAYFAIDAVKKASDAVMRVYREDFSSSLKEDDSPITKADLESNEIIKQTLASSGLHILSEEDDDQIIRINQEKIWIVDPLDGTSDFVKRTGEFTIMIGLVQKQIPILGVISRPTTNTLYVAQRNSGAFKLESGRWFKLKVSEEKDITQCKAVGSRFHLSEQEKEFFKKLGVAKFESRGSSLKVAEICEGMADLYLTTSNKIKQWDTCASHCLITESGGKISDMLGNPILYNTEKLNHENGLIVTNGLIHEEIIRKYSL